MFIEIEGFNGAQLLIAVDKIVSITTYTSIDSDIPKTFTAVRTVIDTELDEEGVQEFYQSNESYESIKQKIMEWYKPTWRLLTDEENAAELDRLRIGK